MAVIQTAYYAHLKQKALDVITQVQVYFLGDDGYSRIYYINVTDKTVSDDGTITVRVQIPTDIALGRRLLRADLMDDQFHRWAAVGISGYHANQMLPQDDIMFEFKFKIIADE